MQSVTSEHMRELDRLTIEEFGIPGEVLMETAGRGLADSILRRAAWLGSRFHGVVAVAGRGNNGGDAFVAARCLAEAGVSVKVYTSCALSSYQGDAAVHLSRMCDADVELHELCEPGVWVERALDCRGQIIVDGLLGTGAKGAPRGTAKAAIEWINRMSDSNQVVAVDIPSGLNADSGENEGCVVTADWTVTMGFPKTGLLHPIAVEYVGNLEVVDIGIPEAYCAGSGDGLRFIAESEVREFVPKRGPSSHKGSHGTVAIIAGSEKYPGAAVLCAMGAIRSGAGLVYVITAASAASAVTSAVPEAIVRGVAVKGDGALDPSAVREALADIPKPSSLVAGPGMTDSPETKDVVEWLLAKSGYPIVIDADAINVLGGGAPADICSRTDLIITPHPGEAGRLLDIGAADVQRDRLSALRRLAERVAGVIVLKGAGTLIGGSVAEGVNLTGNCGMAKGGSGDVLAGLIGGLAAQGLPASEAAELGVFVHGRAGDIAACRGSVHGMIAGDTAASIPDAFSSLDWPA